MTAARGAVDVLQPFFGAIPGGESTTFRVWAPAAREVTLLLESDGDSLSRPMAPEGLGVYSARVAGVSPGQLYRFSLDGGTAMPDPASRFQPLGVHGPSEVVDPSTYTWKDQGWPGVDAEHAVIYELHVGTFTRAGTFAGVAARVPYLRDLGVTVLNLMPVADFAGNRNWGYDGVCLFAPSRVYGRPDDLRRLVDVAHGAGLAVTLDVVYNHLGPDGAYLYAFAPQYFSSRHEGPWGRGVNLDGPESTLVRRFILDNVRHWLSEYHFDGLRLDATHALDDDSPTHIVAEIVETARRVGPPKTLIVAEDERNDARLLRDEDGGWGLDAVWADDFHHIVRRILAGDSEGYYEDFEPSLPNLAATLQRGWFFTGQHSRHLEHARGTDPSSVPHRKFVICVQNHDQVGNRAFGDRLHHGIDLAAYRAASALLLFAPETPLLFMGQEWAASTPFTYFTDHNPELGERIVEGRRREFARFSQFHDLATRDRIPSPQDPMTFERSRLDWTERDREPHRGVRLLYQRCLDLRRRLFDQPDARDRVRVDACGEDALVLRYDASDRHVWIVTRLRGAGSVTIEDLPAGRPLLTTEDAPFAVNGRVPDPDGRRLHFVRPATVVFAAPQ